MPIVWIIVLLFLAGLLVTGAVVHALAGMLLRPPRMTDGKALYVLRRMSPGDLGLRFEPVHFDVLPSNQSPNIQIAGWWIESAAPSQKTVILIHGYADAKVGALAWAPTWLELGYNCLLIDLRGHGESGGSICTGGVIERDDVNEVINHLVAQRPMQARELVLFGISLGGAVALATAARRNDITAVVADSTFSDYAAAATVHARLIGAPLPALLPWVIRWAERLAGIRFASARPLDALQACRCPVMLIHGERDPFVPDTQVLEMGKALINRHRAGDVHWIVEEAGHVLSIAADPAGYGARVDAFLQGAAESHGAASAANA